MPKAKIPETSTTSPVAILLDIVHQLETDIKKLKLVVTKLTQGTIELSPLDIQSLQDEAAKLSHGHDGELQVIEGIFDGYFMMGADTKKYPIPLNYSSKSKLVQWDHLKLRILSDGTLQYKIIKLTDRKLLKAIVSKQEDKRTALAENNTIYQLNPAAVSFFSGKPGDECTIIVNTEKNCNYAAIEIILSS